MTTATRYVIDLLGDKSRLLKYIDHRDGLAPDERAAGTDDLAEADKFFDADAAEVVRLTWIAEGFPSSVVRVVRGTYPDLLDVHSA